MLTHLVLPDPPPEKAHFKPDDIYIIDPCCGEAEALSILSWGLGEPEWQGKPRVTQAHTYGVELHRARSEASRRRLPDANIIGPCSFFGAEISPGRFSLAYVNPPFDYAADGSHNREEMQFVRRAYELLNQGGILVLVCPMKALIGNESFVHMIDSMFEGVMVYRFPDEARPYNEVCLFGKKRKSQIDVWNLSEHGCLVRNGWHHWRAREGMKIEMLPALGEKQPLAWVARQYREGWDTKTAYEKVGEHPEIHTWTLPYSWPPRRFNKIKMTDEERAEELAKSPLWGLIREPDPEPLPEPWMAPKKGHTIMLMVSGLLDGLVPTDPPHVARGHYLKKERIAPEKCKTVVNEDTGATTTTTVYSEEPVSLVRLVEVDEFGEPHIYELRSDSEETESDGTDDESDSDEEEYP